MASWPVLLAVLLAAVVVLVLRRLLFPLRQVGGIPTVPFWVALLPLVRDVDQQETFERYIKQPLREHGAVKIFFAAQWNILVHRPSYVAELFRHEDVYQKSGNHKKIPRSVLASLTGDNIISSHGETWRRYQRVIKPGLQASPDLDLLLGNARSLRNMLLEAQSLCRHGGAGVAIQSRVQRYTIANVAQAIFGVDFGTIKSDTAPLHQIQYTIKKDIFRPVFMNFPFLDTLGFPSRRRARGLASHFTDQLVSGLEDTHVDGKATDASGSLSRALLDARQDGTFTEQQFRDNVTILFIAGQENPQLAIISTLYILAKHPDIQDDLYKEFLSYNDDPVSQESLHSMPLLSAVVLESIRLFPPIGQLINRRASRPAWLGGDIFVPEGTYLGYHCYSTNRDCDAWGADANEFRPRRWGLDCREIQKEYRRRRSRAEFISFHGGQRACLGERFALLQLKTTLYVLVKSLRWRLDPTWPDRMTPAGPLCPRNLHLVFEKRQP